MKATKFKERRSRREIKPGVKTILKLLHLHPCYFLNMYRSGEFTNVELIKYLKLIYPSKTLENASFGEDQVIDVTPLVKREQERSNLLLISFIKQVVANELKDQRLQNVDFTKEGNLIGELFYHVFKSQERNMDTVCSMLAHLMDKFVLSTQEGKTYEARNDGKNKKGDANADLVQDQFCEPAITMYYQQIEELVQEIKENKVLNSEELKQSTNFKLNAEWQSLIDEELDVPSFRFSSEVSLMI